MNIIFNIEYRTQWGESLAVKTDASEQLIHLSYLPGDVWHGEAELNCGTQYRYCVVHDNDEIVRIESVCLPHVVEGTANEKGELILNDKWAEPKRIAGIAVPVFSLRTKGSQGVGDFGDLKMLIDWATRMGLRAIQILPINDTTNDGTYRDSYPYNCISSFALHPMYLDLRKFGEVSDELNQLNTLPQIDYEKVNIAKRKAIIEVFKQTWKEVKATADFKQWKEKNEYWLRPYSQFRAQQTVYDFESGKYSPELYCFTQYMLHLQLKEAADYARHKGIILKGDIPIGVSREGVEVVSYPDLFNADQSTGAPPDFFSADGQNWGFPTYNWDEMAKDGYTWWKRRMQNMAQYFSAYRIDHILGFFRIWAIPMAARKEGEVLKMSKGVVSGCEGQFQPAIPMSIDEICSYGLWLNEADRDGLFIEDFRTKGTYHPRINGQSTETYNKLDDNQKQAFNNLYNNFFFNRNEQFWYGEAMKKLPALTRSNLMICCGEDLGMVPSCVPTVMNQLNILSLEIENMPKALGTNFGNPQSYPFMSVCTISSHDTHTLRGWWEDDPVRAQDYYNNVLHLCGKAPEKLPGWMAEQIICHNLAANSALCILTLQDWIGIEERLRNDDAKSERINEPANPRHYWRWRMHLNLEELVNDDAFNRHVSQLCQAYGR
ncbi:MAG: 4-alpha-glucanotransferase [Prevotellaceae bacterium]|nr:4-alpha-glucanotransferase [Prevotellaceae bacterium]